jgi:hypothetical protein
MEEGVWEAARCVRPYLVEYVGAAAAAEMDATLSRLLNDGTHGEEAERRLREVLDAHEATSMFLERVLEDAPAFRPPWFSTRRKGFQDLPGDQLPVGADKFKCPNGDFVWYQLEVGSRIPPCPTHRCTLEPA